MKRRREGEIWARKMQHKGKSRRERRGHCKETKGKGHGNAMDVDGVVEEKRRREEEIRVIKMQAKANREVKGRGQARALQRKERKPARKHDGCRWRTGEEEKRRGDSGEKNAKHRQIRK